MRLLPVVINKIPLLCLMNINYGNSYGSDVIAYLLFSYKHWIILTRLKGRMQFLMFITKGVQTYSLHLNASQFGMIYNNSYFMSNRWWIGMTSQWSRQEALSYNGGIILNEQYKLTNIAV